MEVDKIQIHDVLDKNDHYHLCVVTLPDTPTKVYSIIHARHGVPEMSTSILANARKMFDMLTRWEVDPSSTEQGDLPDVVPPPEYFS